MTRAAAALLVVVALAAGVSHDAAGRPGARADASVAYLLAQERSGGGFGEPGSEPTLSLTAWTVLALHVRGAEPGAGTRGYLVRAVPATVPELALAVMARAVLGLPTGELVARIHRAERPNGLIGTTLNSTMWGVLALRQVRAPVPAATRRMLLARQRPSGGWGWAVGVAPDSNDTAAAVQALRSLGVRGRPITRALRFLQRHQNRDGGFELSTGRGSDTQSTAWAIQAYVAAGARVPASAGRYLARMRRPDGSYRYSRRYPNATPVWVTAQALPAVARKPFPLRAGRAVRRHPVAGREAPLIAPA